MFKKIFAGFTVSLVSILLTASLSSAQDGVDVDLTTGGSANCVFNGKVPFRKIKAANNNLVVNTEAETTDVSISSELDTDKSTINADIFATIDVSDPFELLNGESVDFESDEFEFSISKTRKSDGKLIQITNETSDGDLTTVTGNVVVNSFDSENNLVSGVLKMIFENTLKTIEKLDEDIQTDENGKVIVTCRFKDVPVNFSGGFGI